jgi:predicted RNA binding protein YcfA (HicA-like mRNA interferase family)
VILLEDYGFQQGGKGGSHRIFRRELGANETQRIWRVTLVEPHGKQKYARLYQVKQALEAIDESEAYRKELEGSAENGTQE